MPSEIGLIGPHFLWASKGHTACHRRLSPLFGADVLFDGSQLRQGDTVFLKSLAFDTMENDGMMAMMGSLNSMSGKNSIKRSHGSTRLDDGLEFNLLKLVVTKAAQAPRPLPARLSQVQPIDIKGASQRTVRVEMGHMRWLINGETFRMDSFPIDAQRNRVEVWDLHNAKQSMPHPMYIGRGWLPDRPTSPSDSTRVRMALPGLALRIPAKTLRSTCSRSISHWKKAAPSWRTLSAIRRLSWATSASIISSA